MFSSPKANGGKSAPGSQGGGPTSTNSTPPPSQQQPAGSQQQPQPGVPYTYGAPAHQYPIPFPFALVGAPHQHGRHPHQQNPGGPAGMGGGGNHQQGSAAALIDPMLSTLSDGEGGMSEDEGAGGVKGSANTSVSSGNNGISSVVRG